MSLAFLHLSDLHLRKPDRLGDPDDDLRNELVQDLIRLRSQVPDIDGVLISGDVAYHGSLEEYDIAEGWLDGLCSDIGVEESKVWVVPGNHDVDQTVIKGDAAHAKIRGEYRPASPARPLTLHEGDGVFRTHIGSSLYSSAFLDPLAAYNEFAASYDCDSTVDGGLVWTEDFPLADGLTLRLHGLNSALISDHTDDDGARKLFVGTDQLSIKREPGVVHVAMCHHPPDWLIGQVDVERHFTSRTSVQLFGHRHDHWDTTMGETLRVYSGALHPSRGHDWRPQYNVMSFDVDGDVLVVRAWFRSYDVNKQRFVAHSTEDGEPVHTYRVHLTVEPVLTPASTSVVPIIKAVEERPAASPVADTGSFLAADHGADSLEGTPMPVSRQLHFRFHRLPFVTRMRLAVKLDLVEEGDDHLSSIELANEILRRAESRGCLDALRSLVNAADSP